MSTKFSRGSSLLVVGTAILFGSSIIKAQIKALDCRLEMQMVFKLNASQTAFEQVQELVQVCKPDPNDPKSNPNLIFEAGTVRTVRPANGYRWVNSKDPNDFRVELSQRPIKTINPNTNAVGYYIYSLTLEKFKAKNEQQQREIIRKLIDNNINRLTSESNNGKPKSKEQLKSDRRAANVIRAFFTNYGVKNGANSIDYEFVGINALLYVTNISYIPSSYLKKTINVFFVDGLDNLIDIASKKETKNFSFETDMAQVLRLRNEQNDLLERYKTYMSNTFILAVETE